jgi:hypothetical protein
VFKEIDYNLKNLMTLINPSQAYGFANTMREASLHYFDIKEWRIEADRQFAV